MLQESHSVLNVQIEKHALATAWASAKNLQDYIIGVRIQYNRSRSQVDPNTWMIYHLESSSDFDSIPCAQLSNANCEVEQDQDLSMQVHACVNCQVPASYTQQRLYQYKQAHLVDPVCYYIMKYCREE